jgi:lysozyme
MRRIWLLLGLAGCGGTLDLEQREFALGTMVCPKGAVTQGVDVSHYDGVIDWAKAHAAGIDFAIMKATQANNFVDPQYAANWTGAGQSGVIRGAYHFFDATVDAVTQADYFIMNAGKPQAGDLPMALDLEQLYGVAPAQVAKDALTFLQHVEQVTGRKPILYTSPNFFISMLGSPAGFDSYVLWDVTWDKPCPNIPSPPWSDWTIWQKTASGMINGIPGSSGLVDLDEFNGSLSDLMNWLNPPAPDGGGSADLATTLLDLAGPSGALDMTTQPPHEKNAGCSCQLASSGPAPWWPLVALMLLALRSRRSRR